MPRKVVPLVTDEYYHVFNRGADKRDIFMDKADYLRFYQSLNFFNTQDPTVNFDSAKVLQKNTLYQSRLVEVKAYALLPNHYHLVLKQLVDGGVSEYIKRISGGYTSYFNQKQKRSGVLFQGKFKRVHIDSDTQYQYLLVYVNENHTVHNVTSQREICHTSSLHYQGLAKSVIISAAPGNYDYNEAVTLAETIYGKRQLIKSEILFE